MTEYTNCVCARCHGKFHENDLIRLSIESPAASMFDRYASPCCQAEWYYEDND